MKVRVDEETCARPLPIPPPQAGEGGAYLAGVVHSLGFVRLRQRIGAQAVPQRSLPPCGGGTGRGVMAPRCLLADRC